MSVEVVWCAAQGTGVRWSLYGMWRCIILNVLNIFARFLKINTFQEKRNLRSPKQTKNRQGPGVKQTMDQSQRYKNWYLARAKEQITL